MHRGPNPFVPIGTALPHEGGTIVDQSTPSWKAMEAMRRSNGLQHAVHRGRGRIVPRASWLHYQHAFVDNALRPLEVAQSPVAQSLSVKRRQRPCLGVIHRVPGLPAEGFAAFAKRRCVGCLGQCRWMREPSRSHYPAAHLGKPTCARATRPANRPLRCSHCDRWRGAHGPGSVVVLGGAYETPPARAIPVFRRLIPVCRLD